MITKECIIEALQKVLDPEIGVDVWTLGLIYDIKIEPEVVTIKMTLTTPSCPYGFTLMQEIEASVKGLGVEKVTLDLVFDPQWTPSDDLRAMLGI
ncbi:MAG: metal-sulfur cluster assembly factor [Nanoarchaeota archaeon]